MLSTAIPVESCKHLRAFISPNLYQQLILFLFLVTVILLGVTQGTHYDLDLLA